MQSSSSTFVPMRRSGGESSTSSTPRTSSVQAMLRGSDFASQTSLLTPRENREVQQKKAPVIQKKALVEGDDILTGKSGDGLLDAVFSAREEYNKVASLKGADGFQSRFDALQALERSIYEWFADVSEKNLTLGDEKNTKSMKALLAECENEHQKLVEKSKDMKDVLPFDAGDLKGEELALAKSVWQDIVNSRGNIKIVSRDDKYRRRVLSELGKILSTPTGRSMLAFLNTPVKSKGFKQKPIPLSQIFIGDSLDDLPKDLRKQSKDLMTPHESMAQPLGKEEKNPHKTNDRKTKKSDKHLPTVKGGDTKGHFDAVVGGQRGYKTDDGETRAFSKGVGSFVTSFSGGAMNVDENDHEILTPGWVTLGHELGHSANMKAGATRVTDNKVAPSSSFKEMAKGKGGVDLWDNAEELLVIENVENGLRSESGQATRRGHHPPQWAINKALKEKEDAVTPLRDLQKKDYGLCNLPQWRVLFDKVKNMDSQVIAGDPTSLDEAKREIKDFLEPENLEELRAESTVRWLGEVIGDQGAAGKLVGALSGGEVKQVFDWLWGNKDKWTWLAGELGMSGKPEKKSRWKSKKNDKGKEKLGEGELTAEDRVQVLREVGAGTRKPARKTETTTEK